MCSNNRQSSIGTRCSRSHWFIATVLAALAAGGVHAADQPASAPPHQVLHLADGTSSVGEIRPSVGPENLRWQAASAGSPADFRWDKVDAIYWPPPAKQPKPSGDFCFELAAGDVLFGSLLALDEQRAELDVPRLGRIHVRRSKLQRIDRWRDGADVIYAGPNGLAGWHEPTGAKNWREDSGRLMTDRTGASVQGNFGLPDRASIEFEISWTSRADFAFALGVDDTDKSFKRAFRFEVWSADMVVQREADKEADLAVVAQVALSSSRTHLKAYLDQTNGRILVFSPGGRQLAYLKVGAGSPVLPGLRLLNLRGDMCLEWLRISPWNGELARELRAGQARVHRADGSIIDGHLTGLDVASKEFLIKTEQGESRVSENQVSSALLSAPSDDAARTIRAVYQDGAQVSGNLVKVEDDALTVTVPGIEEPLRLPLAGLRSLVVLRQAPPG